MRMLAFVILGAWLAAFAGPQFWGERVRVVLLFGPGGAPQPELGSWEKPVDWARSEIGRPDFGVTLGKDAAEVSTRELAATASFDCVELSPNVLEVSFRDQRRQPGIQVANLLVEELRHRADSARAEAITPEPGKRDQLAAAKARLQSEEKMLISALEREKGGGADRVVGLYYLDYRDLAKTALELEEQQWKREMAVSAAAPNFEVICPPEVVGPNLSMNWLLLGALAGLGAWAVGRAVNRLEA